MDKKIPSCIQRKNDKIILFIHAKPGSKKEGIIYIDDDSIEIAVHAQAQNNKANLALIEYLCDIFDLSKNSVNFESGGTSRNKTISIIKDISLEEVYKILQDNMI